MPAISPRALDSWTPGTPPQALADSLFVLVHGNDEGGVVALCADLLRGGPSPKVVAADALNPQDIRTHLSTGGLFGDAIPLRVTGAGDKHLKTIKACFENLEPSARVIIDAGTLKKDSKLKAFIESIGSSAVLHPLDAKAAATWLNKAITAAGATAKPATIQAASERLPSDRMRLTRVSETLALHALGAGRTEVTQEDLTALVGQDGDVDLTAPLLHALDGQITPALISLDIQLQSGENPIGLLRAWGWKLHRIDDMVRANTSPANAVSNARPPVFFAERPLITRILGRLQAASITQALAQMDTTEQGIVSKGHNPRIAMERFLLKLAALKG